MEASKSATGSLRYNKGKPEFSQLPPEFILELAKLLTDSAKKYSKWNYALGQSYCMAGDSLMRHVLALMAGEDIDPESEHHHALHIAAGAMIIWTTYKYQVENHPELDDRLHKFLQSRN